MSALISPMNTIPPPVVLGLNLMASLKLGSTFYCSSQGIWSSSVGLSVISNENSLRRTREQAWLWRRRRRRGNCITCAVEEDPRSTSILREAGNLRRAARQADSVIKRIENAQEVIERRALAKMSTKLYPRSLLESLEERIAQNRWERALKVSPVINLFSYSGFLG